MSFLEQPIVLKLFEFLTVIGTLGGLVLRNVSPRDGMSKKDLLKIIEEKDRQLERLTIANHAHRMRLEHYKKQHRGSSCK